MDCGVVLNLGNPILFSNNLIKLYPLKVGLGYSKCIQCTPLETLNVWDELTGRDPGNDAY